MKYSPLVVHTSPELTSLTLVSLSLNGSRIGTVFYYEYKYSFLDSTASNFVDNIHTVGIN